MSAVRPLSRPGLAALCILFTSFSPANGDTAVSGTISASTTWTLANSPYVVTGDLTVAGADSPVLTIEPGVVVKAGDLSTVSIGTATLPGGLQAVGTPAAPIRFTTTRASVQPGSWRGIRFEAGATSSSRMAFVTVDSAGFRNAANEAGIMLNASVTVEDVTVTSNRQVGIRIYGGAPTIRRCVVAGTQLDEALGFDIYGGSPTITDTSITGNVGAAFAIQSGVTLNGMTGLTVSGNGQNIVRYRTQTIAQNEVWRSFGVPYQPDGSVTVAGAASPTLTIEPGLEIRFNDIQTFSIGTPTVPGGLLAIGTPAAPIRFTTSRASVQPGSWRGIRFEAGATSSSRMAFVTVDSAGFRNAANEAGIMLNASVTVEDVTVTSNRQVGIRIYGGAPTIRRCVVAGTQVDEAVGLDISAGSPTITDTSVTGNAGAAFAIQSGVTLNGMTGLTVSGNGQNIVRYRSQAIAQDEVWRSFGVPYQPDGSVTVAGAASPTLTIEPGLEIRFNDIQTFSIGTPTVPGGLLAIGTPATPIRFTTSRGSVQPGSWRGIRFEAGATSSSRIAFVTVDSAGFRNAANEAGIMLNASVTVEDVTVTSNRQVGIRIYGGAPTIRRCVVAGTQLDEALGFDIYGGSPTITDTAITGNAGAAFAIQGGVTLNGMTGLTVSGNGQNMVRFRSTTLTVDQTWPSFGIPYRLDGSLTVAAAGNPTLTIAPGVTVQMNDGQTFSIGSASQPGTLVAVGTLAQPIRFTTSRASVVPGTWRGLWFEARATTSSRLENAIVEAGGVNGNGTEAGIVVNGSSPAFEAVTVRQNAQLGIRVNAGGPVIRNCVIRDNPGNTTTGLSLSAGVSAKASFNSILNNGGSGITNSSSTASLRFNTVSGNGFEALRSFAGAISARDNTFAGNGQKVRNDDATRTVDVRQQWWGDANGPTGLAARIEFDPWLGSPPTPLYAVATFHRSTAAFNPTGGGVYFTFTLPAPGTWTLRVETSGGTEVKTFTGSGASGQVLWNGTDLASTAVTDATYTYRFNATETATATAAAPLVGRVAVDRTIPVALLTAPLPGSSITAPITVTGSAAGAGFTNYMLEAGEGEFPPTVTTVDRRSVATTAGTLGQWSALLDKPLYTLRLTVNGTGGKKAVSEALLTPAGQAVCP